MTHGCLGSTAGICVSFSACEPGLCALREKNEEVHQVVSEIETAFSALIEESRRAPPEVRRMIIKALLAVVASIEQLPPAETKP